MKYNIVETVNVPKLNSLIASEQTHRQEGDDIYLVMSQDTWNEILNSGYAYLRNATHQAQGLSMYNGCYIVINNKLLFGEIDMR